MLALATALLALVPMQVAADGAPSACPMPNICFSGMPDGAGNIVITVQTNVSGWIGFGVNTKMAMVGADVYVAWLNSTGGVVFSSRHADKEALPSITNDPAVALVQTPASVTTPSWAKIAFSFKRPINATIPLVKASTNFLWAYSDVPPSKPDSPASPFSVHKGDGYISNFDPFEAMPASGQTPGNTPDSTASNTPTKSSASSFFAQVQTILALLAVPAIATLVL